MNLKLSLLAGLVAFSMTSIANAQMPVSELMRVNAKQAEVAAQTPTRVFKRGARCYEFAGGTYPGRGSGEFNPKSKLECSAPLGVISFEEIYTRGWRVVAAPEAYYLILEEQ